MAKRAKNPAGDMPFLDHLEELRWRILWSLLALAVGAVIGFFLVQRFDVLTLLKQPIEPFLPEGKLFVTRPTDAFLITLKLALVIGLVLAFPVILAQIWRFVTPALYEHERRMIVPALLAGLGLFIAGAVMAFLWVLPAVLRILFSFQHRDLEFIITADAYFGFATQMILAFGILFETPLVMVMLSGLGLISPQAFARHRPIALVLASIVAALLTPPDALSMMMMMVPVVVLYELGIVLARLVGSRRRRGTIGTAAILLVLCGAPTSLDAQQPPRPQEQQPDSAAARARADSLGQPMDTATARRLGLPTAPSRSMPQADSIMQELLRRAGFSVLRYAADSVTLFGGTNEVVLSGSALVEREGSMLEADTVRFRQNDCRLFAAGDPALFDRGTVLVGEGMRYDTCERIGTVREALTSFQQSGVQWFLRGGLEVDSGSTRIYGASANLSSCDQPEPHYYFGAGSVKWVSNTIMVARPAILYVRDVPIMWLPFLFQDMRQGRRSGMLVPRFGISDLVRPNSGYRRHVSNIGYYFAISDYTDFQASLDWFSGNFISLNGQFRYRWLNRFLSGGVSVSRIWESGAEGSPGQRSMRLQWNHQQSFDMRTRLSASVDFATSARVLERNAVDPFVQTATLASNINFSKQFDWGVFTAGGSRRQDLSNNTVSQTLPTITLSPSPIDIGESVTWSPGFSFTNSQSFDQQPGTIVDLPPVGGVPRKDTTLTDTRNTSFSLRTPFRIGRWNWQNDLSVTDVHSNRAFTVTIPDPLEPGDSLTRRYSEDFRTGVDWNTSINLPTLFPGTWKLQPSLGIANATAAGPFLLRTPFTGGDFVAQGKRLSFGASISPTLFGFFPGIGPVSRVRHALSPRVRWNYAPAAEVNEAYARALDPTGRNPVLRSPAAHSISLGLSQTFEGKLRPAPGDTTTDPRQARKLKLMSIQTSDITYDFEQAKEEGRTGWRTQNLSNQFTSDLLPGFSLSMTHDLWRGQVGSDTAQFDPFLTSVSARFSLSSHTFRSIFALLTGGTTEPDAEGSQTPLDPQDPIAPEGTGFGPRSGLDPTLDRITSGARGRGLRASFTYDDQRRRPIPGQDDSNLPATSRNNRTLGMSLAFQPSEDWSVSWNTLYNLTTNEFGQHVVRLDRDLHRWRATFSFIRAPNGNFAFNFFISLTDQPDIKFQYDQRTVRQGGVR